MKIALIGATGYVGAFILKEALIRHHQVTAIVREPEKVSMDEKVIVKKGDVLNQDDLVKLFRDQDVVISSFNAFTPSLSNDVAYDLQIKGTKSLINAAKESGVNHLFMVGGAGSLEIAGKRLVDTREFPAEWKEMALAMSDVLTILKNERILSWSFLSPAALLQPGKRTGKFKLGKNQLIVNEQGESKISTQDYAVAVLNEIENPAHIRQRFTVGY